MWEKSESKELIKGDSRLSKVRKTLLILNVTLLFLEFFFFINEFKIEINLIKQKDENMNIILIFIKFFFFNNEYIAIIVYYIF